MGTTNLTQQDFHDPCKVLARDNKRFLRAISERLAAAQVPRD